MNTIDVLVVGSGLAGTLFSLELAKRRPDIQITIISKKDRKSSSSWLAQGGIAAVLPETGDNMEQHVQDTLVAGAYANDPEVVKYFVSRSSEAITTLENWGIKFDRNSLGNRSLALEGGHSIPRVLHHKDFTGKHIMHELYAQLKLYPNIQLLQDIEVFELIPGVERKSINGVHAWDFNNQKVISIPSPVVVLSTGGVGSLFRYSTNPSTATGQGIAMAMHAGASVKDLINIQFHPTAFYQSSGVRLPLISEALRGAGAVLRNQTGTPFMKGQHPLADLAPRDIVARAILKEIRTQRLPYVYLDGTSIDKEEWKNHFPDIYRTCFNIGLDPRKDWIPVVPAAHYSCGGVVTDVKGKTEVGNLYILGESACTGLHGANRLASNSLLEATVMATSLAEAFAKEGVEMCEKIAIETPKLTSNRDSMEKAESFLNEIREVMQSNCSVVKTTEGLHAAAGQLEEVEIRIKKAFSSENFDGINLLLSLYTAKLIVTYSLKASENRGVFYNDDLVEKAE